MAEPMKTCAACRSEIHPEAVVCPHCNYNTRYDTWLKMPSQSVERRGGRRIIAGIITAVPTIVVGGVGLLMAGLAGILIAAGFGAIVYLGVRALFGKSAADRAQVTCPSCGQANTWLLDDDWEEAHQGVVDLRCACNCVSRVFFTA